MTWPLVTDEMTCKCFVTDDTTCKCFVTDDTTCKCFVTDDTTSWPYDRLCIYIYSPHIHRLQTENSHEGDIGSNSEPLRELQIKLRLTRLVHCRVPNMHVLGVWIFSVGSNGVANVWWLIYSNFLPCYAVLPMIYMNRWEIFPSLLISNSISWLRKIFYKFHK